jgi:8-oxo-dGTP diphosphatase
MSELIYLVRHAKAGNRSAWTGDDRPRPLTAEGWWQAGVLADRLAPLASGLLLSSPYLRCIQTLRPLADMLRTEVTVDERLAEGIGVEGALDLLHTTPDGTVLSSHGDVIPDSIRALERRGTSIESKPQWGKACVWVLERTDGTITRATAWAPPEL